MLILGGKGVSDSVAIGPLYFYHQSSHIIKKELADDAAAEKHRFAEACDAASGQLDALYEKSLAQVGEAGAMIFRIHQMMLTDIDYTSFVESTIEEQSVTAEYAVSAAADNFSRMFAEMDDEYMRARAADIRDVSERVLKILLGEYQTGIQFDEPVIIVADDLAPSQTIQLDKSKILGFVTFRGSDNSHTAILARTMNLPAVVAAGEIDSRYNGETAVISGIDGTVIIAPDEPTLGKMRLLKKETDEKRSLLLELKGKPNETKDGRRINVYANIGSLSDIDSIIRNDAGGIGLFRSEFLYLENDVCPTEDEQFAVYKTAAEKMNGKPIIIRTPDIGADKTADYFNLEREENPALGCRAIRISLRHPDVFKTQLRAILRASAYGNISMMFPMITSAEEVIRIKKTVEDVKDELRADDIAFNESIKTGIMIETPAAALISAQLAKIVDFFSIGTNDLSQYTLAIDRRNSQLDEFFNPHHEAILSLIRMTVENAHAAGIPCGICGELGSDTSLTEQFILMGVDELSVSPPSVLKVRKKIRSLDLSGK